MLRVLNCLFLLYLLLLFPLSAAGDTVLSSDFRTLPGTINGNAVHVDNAGFDNDYLQLTDTGGGQNGRWFYSPLEALTAFEFFCEVYVGDGGGADGFSFSYSDIDNVDYQGELGDDSPGFTVQFVTYNNPPGANPRVETRYNGSQVAVSFVNNSEIRRGAWVPLRITVNTSNQLTVAYNNFVFVNNVTLSGWNPQASWSISMGARTGGVTDNHWVDDVRLRRIFPAVSSINRTGSANVGGATTSVGYLVNMSEPVQNLNQADFAVTTVSGAPAASIASVSSTPTVNVSANFELTGSPGTFTGVGAATGGAGVLTPNTSSVQGGWYYAPGVALPVFRASFDLKIGDGGGADGMAFAYGDAVSGGFGEDGPGGNSLALCFDSYNNGNEGTPIVEVRQNGTVLSAIGVDFRGSSFKPVTVTVNSNGVVSATLDGNLLITATLSGWNPQATWQMGFGARTGGTTDMHAIDNFTLVNATYAATLDGLGGIGTIRLDSISASDAVSYSGEPLLPAAFASGQTYFLDYVAPAPAVSGSTTLTNAIRQLSIDFGEVVSGLLVSEIDVTNGIASNLQTSDNQTYTFDVLGSADGTVEVTLAAGVAQDAVLNDSLASNTLSFPFDNSLPGVSLSSVASDPVNGAIVVSVTLTESSIDFAAGDITPTNAGVSGFSGSGTSYSFTLTPSAEGAFSAVVNAGVFTDAAGNTNTASNTISRTFDGTAPGATLSSAAADPVNSAITVSVALTEANTDFGAGDVTPTNAGVSGFSGSGTTYSFTLTPSTDGPFGAVVNGGVFTDAAGNVNTASNAISRTFDGTAPGVTLSSAAADPVNSAITVSVALTEASTDFDAGDVTPTNATVSGFSGSGTSYSFTLAPLTDGAFGALVNGGVFTDEAGNGNTVSNTVSRTYDGTAPGATLSSVAGDPVNGAITVDVSLTEASTDFDAGDVTPSNALVSGFSGSGTSYSFTLTPSTDGSFGALVNGGVFTDEAGNGNNASNAISRTFDSVAPGVTLSCTAMDPVNAAITVDVSLTEASTDFDAGDVAPTNAAVSDFSGSGTSYSYMLTPSADGAFGAVINAGVFTDAAGNGNTASNAIGRTFDGTDPVISNLVATPDEARAGEEVILTFDASETLVSDPEVTVNGNLATKTAKAAGSYTYAYTVLPDDPDGPATIQIDAIDLAGNVGMFVDDSSLTITGGAPGVPVAAWPLALAFVAAGAVVLRRKSRR